MKLLTILQEIYLSTTKERSSFRKPENFDTIQDRSKYRIMAGGNDWEVGWSAIAVYLDGSEELTRIWINTTEKCFANADKVSSEDMKDNEYKDTAKKLLRSWESAARKLHAEPYEVTENGTELHRDWKTAFIEALNDPEVKPFIKQSGVDKTTWNAAKIP